MAVMRLPRFFFLLGLGLAVSCGSGPATFPVASPSTLPPVNLPARILFIGDSITECMTIVAPGACTSNPGLPLEDGWIGINKGHGGDTSADLLTRFHRDALEPQTWPDGKTAPADVIVLEEDDNDYAENNPSRRLPLDATEANIRSMASQSRNAGRRLVIQTMLPTAPGFFDVPFGPNITIGSYNGAYVDTYNFSFLFFGNAGSREAFLADTFSTVTDFDTCQRSGDFNCYAKAGMLEDGIHPSAQGYAAMFPIIKAAVHAAIQ